MTRDLVEELYAIQHLLNGYADAGSLMQAGALLDSDWLAEHVARRVTAALNEAADLIDASDDCTCEVCVTCRAAAEHVRGLIPKPPAEPADPLVRPAGRTPGTT